MAIRAYGVESVEFAPIGVDGALPTTGWVKITNIDEGSVTFNVPEVTQNNIRVEDVDGIVDVLPGETEPAEISVASLDIDGDKVADLIGGVYTPGVPAVEEPPTPAVPAAYDAPAVSEIKHLAIRVTSRPHRGKKFQFHLVDAAVVSNISATFTRNQMVSLGFTARSTTPFDGDGLPVSPWGWKVIEV
ncbi:MAG: hypothetical protein Q8R83_06100 [Legionellaceae bacterium]|nr:hypothetical protein [Legionellaceae bacterium]